MPPTLSLRPPVIDLAMASDTGNDTTIDVTPTETTPVTIDATLTNDTPLPIDHDTFTTGSLKKLQSDDERKVLDIVDKLRRSGLNGTIELPQLVVCGDQSSGKSSVLEAITEIPFPRDEGLCTRFLTEIFLRRTPASTISVKICRIQKGRPSYCSSMKAYIVDRDKIIPDKDSGALIDELNKIRNYTATIKAFSELPGIIHTVTRVMGLSKIGHMDTPKFSRHVLSMEICGPDRPQL
jgi:hypothetical protein